MDRFQEFFSRFETICSQFPEEIPSYTEIFDTKTGTLLASSFNNVEQQLNSTKHSELLAIDSALATRQKGKYLNDTILYTALEPCLMCAGAIVKAKIPEIVYLVPAKPGEGISSLSLESVYMQNHFPKCRLVPSEEIKSKFLTFFTEKR